jgi:hypothetical protein
MMARGDKVTGAMVNGSCTQPNATLNGRHHAYTNEPARYPTRLSHTLSPAPRFLIRKS